MELETPRLRLSPPRLADAPEIFARYASDRDVTRYMAWPTHRTVDDTRAFVEFSDLEWSRGAGPLLIRDKSTHQLLGSTGFSLTGEGDAMVGYILARDAWGRGYATEALQAVAREAERVGLARLFAPFHPDNVASRRVLERCGFRPDPNWSRHMPCPNLVEAVPAATECYEYVITIA